MPIRDNIKQTKEKLSKSFLKPNRTLKSVHGVGIGRTNENKYTNRIYVTEVSEAIFPQIKEALNLPHSIPNSNLITVGTGANQVTIEIVVTPQASFASNDFAPDKNCKRNAKLYYNPPLTSNSLGRLFAGISVWLVGNPKGTIGYFCRKKPPDSNTYILSNSHVLADFGSASENSKIVRNGKAGNIEIARLSKPIIKVESKTNPTDFYPNKVDAAIAKITFTNGFESGFKIANGKISIQGYCPTPNQNTDLPPNQILRKHGAGSCWANEGFIDDVDCDVIVIKGVNDPLEFLFVNQYRIVGQNSFATLGDSGSLVFDDQTKYAVGLLFAVGFNKSFKRTTSQPLPNTIYALASPISTVMTELEYIELFISSASNLQGS
jgi:hypothetical protein